ncbi:MAG: sulfotransferase [Gemmataceae bacterium]|nr:sulfotransferase [Gemmataceae bacterium]
MTDPSVADEKHDDAPPQATGQMLWAGLPFTSWLRLLIRNRFAVDRPFVPVALANTALSLTFSALGVMQTMCYAGRVARTNLHEPPLFVLGVWRSGTTLLHNLLSLDPRHTSPTMYQCLMPNHFLLTERFVTRRFPLHGKRPMDDVLVTWDQPQEDEYAMCMMGQPSFHLSLAFPNHPPVNLDYLDLDSVPPRAREAWKQALLRFLKRVAYRRPGRLVLKSPEHTARIRTLLELFPDARFVYIVRNPYVVFASLVKMLRAVYAHFGLQRPHYDGIEEFVFTTLPKVLRKLDEGRRLVDPARFHELRYEDLVADPAGQLRTVYDTLSLGDFDVMRPRLESYLAAQAGYRTNRYEMAPGLRDEITRRWGDVIRRCGYAEEAAPS